MKLDPVRTPGSGKIQDFLHRYMSYHVQYLHGKIGLRCRDIRRCHEILKNLPDIFEKESHAFHEHPVVNGFHGFSIYNPYGLDFMLTASDTIIYALEVKTAAGNPGSQKMSIDRRFVDKGIVAKRTRGGHGDVFDTIPIFRTAESLFSIIKKSCFA